MSRVAVFILQAPAARTLVGNGAGGLATCKPVGDVLTLVTDAGLDDDRVSHNLG